MILRQTQRGTIENRKKFSHKLTEPGLIFFIGLADAMISALEESRMAARTLYPASRASTMTLKPMWPVPPVMRTRSGGMINGFRVVVGLSRAVMGNEIGFLVEGEDVIDLCRRTTCA